MKFLWICVLTLALGWSVYGASVSRRRSPVQRKRETVVSSDTGEEIRIGPSYQPTKERVQGMLGTMSNAHFPGMDGPLQGLLGAFNSNSTSDIQGAIQGTFQVLSGQSGNPLEGLQGFLKTFLAELSDRQKQFSDIATDRLMNQTQDVSNFVEENQEVVGPMISEGTKTIQNTFQLLSDQIGRFLLDLGKGLSAALRRNGNGTNNFIQQDAGTSFKNVSTYTQNEIVEPLTKTASKFASRFSADFNNIQSRFNQDLQLFQKNLPLPAIPGLQNPQELFSSRTGSGQGDEGASGGRAFEGVPAIGDILKTIIPGNGGANAEGSNNGRAFEGIPIIGDILKTIIPSSGGATSAKADEPSDDESNNLNALSVDDESDSISFINADSNIPDNLDDPDSKRKK